MANKMQNQFMKTSVKEVSCVFAQITFGNTGAPTLNTGGNYITSVTRNSAGTYTILFNDTWPTFIMAKHVFNSGSSAPASPAMYIKANNTATAATRTLQVVFNAAGTATDPASGEIVYLEVIFKNSSVTY